MGSEGKYLVSQAQQIKARLRIPIGLIQSSMSKDQIAHMLEVQHYQEIRQMTASWDDERLGKVIGDAKNVFSDCKLDLANLIGRDFLVSLAMSAVTYSIATLVWDEVQKAKAEAARPKLATVDDRARSERMFGEGNRFIAYCQSGVGGHWYTQSIQIRDLRLIIGCQFDLPAREIERKIELLKSTIASWASTEKELTIVLEVVEVTNRSVKGAVLFTTTCGPTPSAQEMVDRAAENLRRDLGRADP